MSIQCDICLKNKKKLVILEHLKIQIMHHDRIV